MADFHIFDVSAVALLRYFLLVYLCVISVISAVICTVDKINAKKHKKRVPESDLLLFSALGGSVFMFLTMLAIRHKTRKAKFMICVPLMIFLHCIIGYLILV